MNQFARIALLIATIGLILGLTAARLDGEETKGRIKAILTEQDEFVLSDVNGQELSFRLAEDAMIAIDGKEAALSELRPGDLATVVWGGDIDGVMAVTQLLCKRK